MMELCNRNVPLVLAICVQRAMPFVKPEPDGELQTLLAMVIFIVMNVALVLLNTPPPIAFPSLPELPVPPPLPPTAEFRAMVQFVAANCDALKIPPPNP